MKAHYISLKPLILWKDAERPIDCQQRFGRTASLEVEIGFGNGEFLVRHAQAHPECDFVGIEMEWPSVQKGLRKLSLAQVPNVRLLLADAQVAFERFLAPQSLTRVYTLFPCPWPKKRHSKYRLFSHNFLKLVNSRLVSGGKVQIVTDHRSYLDWVLGRVPGTGFELRWETISPQFDTKYERKWRGQGQQEFYELILHKQVHQEIPLKEDTPLRTQQVPHFDPDHFQPQDKHGEIVVRFRDFLYDPQRQRGMLFAFVAERGLNQEFWIEIARRGDIWAIRPVHGCGMIPTVGVQQALELVRDTVLQHGCQTTQGDSP